VTGSRVALARWQVLLVAAVAVFVLAVGGSAVLAPDVNVGTVEDGGTLIGVQGDGWGWHEDGAVQYVSDGQVQWQEGSADSYFDVTMTDDGRVLAGFMHGGYEDCGPYESPCPHTGFRVIEPDGEPRVIDEYGVPVRMKLNREVHDVERVGPDRYVYSDMDRERIVEVANGTVVWTWNASEVYDPPADPTTRDWLHINDVDVVDDGRYLVSVRNANQLLVVERGEGVVEIINADDRDGNDGNCKIRNGVLDSDGDGDVRCGDPSVLDHQHNPQWLGNGTVLVADSHNDRVVELHRAPNGSWVTGWTVTRTGGMDLSWPRDADRLPNGHTLITDTRNKRIVEVDAEGEVVWSRGTADVPYEADRVPAGEVVGAPSHPAGMVDDNREADYPVLSLALVGLRSAYPDLPFWYDEPQLLATVVALLLAFAGGVDCWRQR
jgi:hypothetical protein